jgi:hypothetical protein
LEPFDMMSGGRMNMHRGGKKRLAARWARPTTPLSAMRTGGASAARPGHLFFTTLFTVGIIAPIA